MGLWAGDLQQGLRIAADHLARVVRLALTAILIRLVAIACKAPRGKAGGRSLAGVGEGLKKYGLEWSSEDMGMLLMVVLSLPLGIYWRLHCSLLLLAIYLSSAPE